jgi:hypothetical protein
MKRYRLEGTTLLEFFTFNPDQIEREIHLEGMLLFKHAGAKVGLPAAAPCICLESLGLAQSSTQMLLKKVRGLVRGQCLIGFKVAIMLHTACNV